MPVFLQRFPHHRAVWTSFAVLVLVLVAVPGYFHWRSRHLAGPYRHVDLLQPRGAMSSYVVLFTDSHGQTEVDRSLARGLAGLGAAVAVVHTEGYLQPFREGKRDCDDFTEDLVRLNKRVLKRLHLPVFAAPVLVATGDSTSIVENAVAGTVPGDISAAILQPPAAMPAEPFAARCAAEKQHKPMQNVQTVAAGESVAQMLAWIQAHFPADGLQASRLPLIEYPVAHSREAVILLSGDGGWRAFDDGLALAFQKRHIAVIGWNSLVYFWTLQTPQRLSADLAQVIASYQKQWHITHFALAGYSFGADVLPLAYLGLSHPAREKVEFIALMGLASNADFKVRIGGWLGWGDQGTQAVMPAVRQIRAQMLQCVYGADEKESACVDLQRMGAHVILRPGGHHFDNNTDALADDVLAGWRLSGAR